ncbi:Uncharacterized protein GBIM_17389 [Gryllus bimaculatus]|nr:Uncharacterized protein GBIM_17389 [Gryllus bimaculatus]
MASDGVSDGGWRRPEDSGPYPREWDRFEGLKPMPDGRTATFWIRDLTPDLEEAVVAHMKQHYVREEQMALATRAADDPRSAADLEGMWREAVGGTRVSLAAFSDWPHGAHRPSLAALNLLGVVRSTDPPMMMEGEKTRPMFLLMNEMLAAADVFRRFGVRSYLVGLGLSVAPPFRGQGVGLRLLQARRPLCAALRIPLSVLETRRYADFALEDGQRPFKDATWTHMEIQAIFYGPRDDEEQHS